MDLLSVLFHPDRSQIGQLTLQYLLLVLVAVGLAILVGVPLGVLIIRSMWPAGSLQGVATVMLTILSIALPGLLMPVYSIFGQSLGLLSAITVVFPYSLLSTLCSTYFALTGVEAGIREADKGIDMTFRQRPRTVDTPLAVPVIPAGARTVVAMNIGVMTIAAMIGAGGLGVLILTFISQSNMPMLVVGAVLVSLLTTVADLLLQWLQRILAPKGLCASAH